MKKIEINEKVFDILSSVSEYGMDNATSEFNAKKEVSKAIGDISAKYSNLNFKASVTDTENVGWKNNEHFTKVFDEEIKYCKNTYMLTRSEIGFLKELGEYLLWQINMIGDEKGNPLNQTDLAKLMDVSTRTVRGNMKKLEEKKCIFSIPYDKDVYYLVNPFLLYKGGKINMLLPILFNSIGYTSKDAQLILQKV